MSSLIDVISDTNELNISIRNLVSIDEAEVGYSKTFLISMICDIDRAKSMLKDKLGVDYE